MDGETPVLVGSTQAENSDDMRPMFSLRQEGIYRRVEIDQTGAFAAR
jgi:hypothetical protein